MTDLSPKFDEKSAAPQLMEPEIYASTLRSLLARGKDYGKTESVAGFLLPDIKVVTETSSGQNETAKDIKVEKFYIIMDLAQYPQEMQRGLVIKDIAKNWGGKTIRERDLNEPDFKGPGLWTNKQGAFEFDYLKANESPQDSVFKPNPEAYRVTLTTKDTVIIPVQWGTFKIEAGGTLAIRDELEAAGVPTVVSPITDVDLRALSEADLVVLGAWTDGLLLVGQRPGRAGRLSKLLPAMRGKRCVVFCTYALDSGKVLEKLTAMAEAHGAEVLGGLAINRRNIPKGAKELVARTLEVPA